MTPTAPVITDLTQLDLSQCYTYADYLSEEFTEVGELVRGRVLRKVAGPARARQRCSMNVSRLLDSHLVGKTCQVFAASFDARLWRSTGTRSTALANGDDQMRTVMQPDQCVSCDPAKRDERGCLGAPDWITKIISPYTATHDTKTKSDRYVENGVSEYWIVFPGEKSIRVCVLQGGEYQAASEYYEPALVSCRTLPELQLVWADVFASM